MNCFNRVNKLDMFKVKEELVIRGQRYLVMSKKATKGRLKMNFTEQVVRIWNTLSIKLTD